MKPTSRKVLKQRARLVRTLPPLEEILRGSFFERRRRCGTPSCHCAEGEGHSTFYLSVLRPSGTIEQLSLPPELAPTARRWVANYRRLIKGLDALSSINREWLRHERTVRKRRAGKQRGRRS
jgi:hypothetical protein